MGRIGCHSSSITSDSILVTKKKKSNKKKVGKPRNWKSIRPQLFVSLIMAFGSLMIGFATAYSSPALASMSKSESKLHPTLEEKSWIGSLLPLFAAVGGLLGGWLMTNIGRKKVIFMHGFPYIVSFAIIAAAQNLAMIMVGRAIVGLCVGISTLVFPVYLGETVEARYRGVLGLFPSILGNAGVLISYSAGMFLGWSKLAILGALLPMPLIIGSYVIPETPRWHSNRGQLEKAIAVLQWLRGTENIYDEFNEIDACQSAKENAKSKCIDIFKLRYLRPLLICLLLMFFQQTSGINAIIFYSVDIFRESGSGIDSNIQSIALAVVNVLATTTAMVLIDRLGRKILLCTSCIIMSSTLLVLGFYFRSRGNQEAFDASRNMDHKTPALDAYGWLPLLCLVIYIIGFSIGFGSIPWLIMGEILPTRIKGRGASITTSFNWLCSFIITKTFGTMILKLGSDKTFWLFGASSVLAIFFVIFFVPETKGKSLEDIEQIFIRHRKGDTASKCSQDTSTDTDRTNSMTNLSSSNNSCTEIISDQLFSKSNSLKSTNTNSQDKCYDSNESIKSKKWNSSDHKRSVVEEDEDGSSIRVKIDRLERKLDRLSSEINYKECLSKHYIGWKGEAKVGSSCWLDRLSNKNSVSNYHITGNNELPLQTDELTETNQCMRIKDTTGETEEELINGSNKYINEEIYDTKQNIRVESETDNVQMNKKCRPEQIESRNILGHTQAQTRKERFFESKISDNTIKSKESICKDEINSYLSSNVSINKEISQDQACKESRIEYCVKDIYNKLDIIKNSISRQVRKDNSYEKDGSYNTHDNNQKLHMQGRKEKIKDPMAENKGDNSDKNIVIKNPILKKEKLMANDYHVTSEPINEIKNNCSYKEGQENSKIQNTSIKVFCGKEKPRELRTQGNTKDKRVIKYVCDKCSQKESSKINIYSTPNDVNTVIPNERKEKNQQLKCQNVTFINKEQLQKCEKGIEEKRGSKKNEIRKEDDKTKGSNRVTFSKLNKRDKNQEPNDSINTRQTHSNEASPEKKAKKEMKVTFKTYYMMKEEKGEEIKEDKINDRDQTSHTTKKNSHNNSKDFLPRETAKINNLGVKIDSRNNKIKKKQKAVNIRDNDTSDKDTGESSIYENKKKVKKRNSQFNINRRRTKQDDKSSKNY